MFYRIAENIDKKEIMQHNVDIKIRHRKWSGENEANTQVTAMKIFEHSYELFSHQLDDYLVHCAVQVYLPKGPHERQCRFVTMEVDMPIRQETPQTIRGYTEKTLHDIIGIAQNIYPKGISVIDQRERIFVIETKIKIIIGTPRGDIPREPGWVRKETHYHGARPAEASGQEAAVAEQQQTPRSEIDGSSADPHYFELQAMEIDSQEASQPPAQSNLGSMTTDAAAIHRGTHIVHRGLHHPIPRRIAVPMVLRPRTPRLETQEEPLYQGRVQNPRQTVQQMREASQMRLPVQSRVMQVRQEARRDAEEAQH